MTNGLGMVGNAAGGIRWCRPRHLQERICARWRGAPQRAARAGNGFGGAHRSVLFAVLVAGLGAGAHADAQHGAGEGFQVAVRCPG